MDEIVELLAREMAVQNGLNPDELVTTFSRGGPNPEKSAWKCYEHFARAALSALHEAGYRVVPNEPTDEMLRQGAMTFYENRHLTTYAHRIPYIYRAMIDASPVKKG